LENTEENCEMIWKIRKKGKLKSEKIWKIWRKSKLNSEKIWKMRKKSKLNSEMIWKIQKKSKLNGEKIWNLWKKSKLNMGIEPMRWQNTVSRAAVAATAAIYPRAVTAAGATTTTTTTAAAAAAAVVHFQSKGPTRAILRNFRFRMCTSKGIPKGSRDLWSLPLAMILVLLHFILHYY
jgi:hypothetical protein